MQIHIVAVGKIKEKHMVQGIQEYLKRLAPYAKIQIVEVADEKTPATASPAEEEAIRKKESERLAARLHSDTYLVALDMKGKLLTSEALAEEVETKLLAGKSHWTFVIGGSLGLDPSLLQRADLRLSFGRLTYPHQLMRLILVEQIYRVFKIIRREPYHK